jgi:hypothetical protein
VRPSLAFGYVDHPPLIPWMARVADELGGSLVALRVPAMAAGLGTMVLTALLVREWGGRWRAQLLALLCLSVAPAHLRLGAMLDIPVVEVFLCTLSAYLVARALSRHEKWSWVLAGCALGFAILAKHSWRAPRRAGTRAVRGRSAALFPPHRGSGWSAGLVFAFTPRGSASRPFAVLFLVMFAFLFVMGGKPYYLASAYPAALAAGGIALEHWLARRIATWRAPVASLTLTGLVLALLTLPVLPIRTVDAAIGSLLGWAVPPMALTHDLHGMHGWEEHAATIDRVYRLLPDRERGQASVLAGTYSQASALNVLREEAVARAVSGNMSYYLWGPDAQRGDVLIVYGLPRELLQRHYRTCTDSARIEAPLARPWDTDLPVYVCREPLGTMAELWPELRRFGHTLAADAPENG